MAWIRVDDRFDEHPKFMSLSAEATALWFHCLAYCNRNLTDGFVPEAKAAMEVFRCVKPGPDAPNPVEALVSVGLWEIADGGYQFHDYRDYQFSKEETMQYRDERIRLAVVGGKARATGASRTGGRFTSRLTSGAAGLPLDQPHQPSTSPVPVPVPVPVPIPEPKTKKARAVARCAFTPPTVLEVAAYCLERRNSVNAQHFVDHYQTRGWRTTGGPVKDWRACVRTWEQNNYPSGPGGPARDALGSSKGKGAELMELGAAMKEAEREQG